MLFTGSKTFINNNYNTTIDPKSRVTVIPTSGSTLVSINPVATPYVNVDMWGGGGASGSTINGGSGSGGAGGYFSASIPTGELNITGLILNVGGGGGNPTYYDRPLDEYAEFNVSTIQHIETQSVSSNPTFNTIALRGTPTDGPTTSVSNATYSTITSLGSASVRNVRTYSTIENLGSVSGANVTSLDLSTIPGLTLQVNDIVLVASASDATTSITEPTSYIPILDVTGTNNNPAYNLSYRRITAADQTLIDQLDVDIPSGGGGGGTRQVTHIAMVFRGVTPTGTPYITPTTATGTGDPNPPAIDTTTPNFMSVIFGFLDNQSVANGDITFPANYINSVSQGTPDTDPDGATVMAASRFLPDPVTNLNPDVFNITAAGVNESYAAVNLGLIPESTLTTVADTLTLPTGLSTNDIILLASVSDSGTITPPPVAQGYTTILSSTTGPSYHLSYKRIGTTIDTQITGLDSTSSNGSDIAHIAMVFRGVTPTGTPYITPTTASGTGSPNPPDITTNTPNFMSVIFGFLNNKSIIPTDITVPANYDGLVSQAVGEGLSATNEATLMSAYRFLSGTSSVTETPAAFGVTGATAGDNNFAITLGLRPQVTLSPISGTLPLPAGTTVNDVVLVASVSDGGNMNIPTNGSLEQYTEIFASAAGASPAYRLSYKRITSTDLLTNTITGLSLQGEVAGVTPVEPAGVSHIAMAFSNVDTVGDPTINALATGTGAVNPPLIAPDSVNFTSVAFGFLANIGVVDSPAITAPGGYTKIPTLSVGSDLNGTTQSTLLSAYTSNPTDVDIDPGSFGGVSGTYAAVTVGLRPTLAPLTAANSITLTNPLQLDDIVLVSSISDGGTMSVPTSPAGFVPISQGNPNCAYQLSYKRITAAEVGTTLISGLSDVGTFDSGPNTGNLGAGVAHLAMVFRGVHRTIDLARTTNPLFSVANNGTGNGSPDPPQINGLEADETLVAFGFLDDRSIIPTSYPLPNGAFQRVGTATQGGSNEGTIMSCYDLTPTPGNPNPAAFGVPNTDGWVAITGRLPVQVNARFSSTSGACGGAGGGYSGIFYTELIGGLVPLVIAGGGGGGGGGTINPFPSAKGGDGGPGGSLLGGSNGNITVLDPITITYRLAGGGGAPGSAIAGGSGGLTLSGPSGLPVAGNAGEAGQFYDFASLVGGRGANSPYTDTTTLPLYGANATGGWNRGPGGGSSRTSSFTIPVSTPTDCGGGGGAGYYGGGGGGSGDGGGGGGGGGGFNYIDPRVILNVNGVGIGTVPAGTDSSLYIPGIGYGGLSVTGSGSPIAGNFGADGLIVLTYFE